MAAREEEKERRGKKPQFLTHYTGHIHTWTQCMHALHHMHIHNHIQPQLTTTFRHTDELDLENGNFHHGFLLHPFSLPPHCRSIICRQISDRISMLSPSPLSLTCFITNGQDELERGCVYQKYEHFQPHSISPSRASR